VNYFDLNQDNQYQNDKAFDIMAKFFKVNLFFEADKIFLSGNKFSYPPNLQDQYLLAVVLTDDLHSGCN